MFLSFTFEAPVKKKKKKKKHKVLQITFEKK